MDIQLSDRAFGATVSGVALISVGDHDFKRIQDLVHERGVVCVKGGELMESEQVAFAARFGKLEKVFLKEALSKNFPELFVVSNILENGRPIGSRDAGRFWHTDGAFFVKPHYLSMLYAVEVPRDPSGRALGDTDFVGMGPAYDGLSESMKRRIDGLRAVHDLHHRYERSDNAQEMTRRAQEFPPRSHPLVIHHPDTGRKMLFLSEGYTTCIEGLPADESKGMLDELLAHLMRPEFGYRHSWNEADLLIWDNRATLHHANFDYELPQRRLMRRATVSGKTTLERPQ